jgi:RNA polymerase sigma factor (sigma-70 family)
MTSALENPAAKAISSKPILVCSNICWAASTRTFRSWLFTTLHREFLKTCRRRHRFSIESMDEGAEDLPNVPADCAERVDSRTLLRILGEIAEDFRAPLVLYYMQDLSYKEIADVLALPLGTVQSRIARAKIQLLRRLSETNLALEQGK